MLQKIDFVAQRIKSYYIGEDSVQVTIPYVKGLTIFDEKSILYHQLEKSDNYINKYLEDERRFAFPYSNIPIYYGKKNGVKLTFVNQLYDFNKPYIVIGNGRIVEHYVLKENKEILLVKRLAGLNNGVETFKKRLEVEEMFEKKNNENIYVMNLDGGMSTYDIPFMTEDEIHTFLQQKLKEYSGYFSHNFRINKEYNKFIENSIENCDFTSNEIMEIPLFKGIVVKMNDFTGMKTDYVNITYMKDDCYKVVEKNIPIRKYNLEMIMCLTKRIYETQEPKISLFQNPNISKKSIKEAKQKIKELTK